MSSPNYREAYNYLYNSTVDESKSKYTFSFNGPGSILNTFVWLFIEISKKRFSGWELNYFCLGKKRFLTFLGTENDNNNDGFLNKEDEGDFYIYDLDLDTLKIVSIPDKKILTYNFLKNTSIVFFDVVDKNRPQTRKNEQFIYRYDLNTGNLKDIIPDEEKKKHLKFIL